MKPTLDLIREIIHATPTIYDLVLWYSDLDASELVTAIAVVGTAFLAKVFAQLVAGLTRHWVRVIRRWRRRH